MLSKFFGSACLNDLPAHPPVEADSFPLYIRARVFEDGENLGVITKLHSDLLENGFGILLDELRALVTEDVEYTNFALNVRNPCHHRRPGGLGCAAFTTAATNFSARGLSHQLCEHLRIVDGGDHCASLDYKRRPPAGSLD